MSWIPRIGAEFAGYRLDSLLGHGGMSIVYRAEHVLLGRKVALKLLSPQLSEKADFKDRFMRESRLAASLDHPNIIPIYEAAESDGVFFIAMRYVEGADLRTLLKQGPLAPERLISIVDQTANALAAAHAQGLVHRDVKPANILIDTGEARAEADHVYLSDFGVAKQTSAPGLTRSGVFVGTAEYAAPEQIEGKELDARADVYSLGCVVYECLTGSSAYDRDSEVALMYAHLLEPPPSVADRRPDLPPEIDGVIAKAMAKSRDDRYGSVKELASALRDVLAGSHSVAAAPGVSPTVVSEGAAAAAAPATVLATPVASGPPTVAAQGAAPAPTRAPAVAASNGGAGTPRPRFGPKMLIAAGAAAAGIVAVVAIVLLTRGGGGAQVAGSAAPPARTAAAPAAPKVTNLLAVLVPTQIAKSCTVGRGSTEGAVETDECTPPENAPTAFPDELRLVFFRNGDALDTAYHAQQKGMKVARCGTTLGERSWIHSTGKRGGRRECFIDGGNRFVILWTHEKLGSPDHVDMLGIAREPGRAPTSFQSWWEAVNDSLGKCRPKVAEDLCFGTIEKLTG